MGSRKKPSPVALEAPPAPQVADGAAIEGVGSRFIGQWNRLVSTTNWEKGRIICDWREALEASGAASSSYADEAWAQLVGGVTSQHVGRLRRVFQRFGAVHGQFDGLYWSHFQAGLDWDDAEMWLEGAIQNGWSVSQMRGKRWETLGQAADAPSDDDAIDQMEETPSSVAEPWADAYADAEPAGDHDHDHAPGRRAARKADGHANRDEPADEFDRSTPAAAFEAPSAPAPTKRKRLAVDVDELPADVADAFEQFKLAIIAHRRANWRDTTPDAVIECLEALRELTLAPADY